MTHPIAVNITTGRLLFGDGEVDRLDELLAVASTTTPVIVAHRGEGDLHPEHTLAAYTSSLAAGRQAVEVSARVTVDGRAVCAHDEDLDRCTDGGATNVADRSWQDLLANVSVDIGASWCGPSWPAQKIPMLVDVLDILAGRCLVFLEPKDASAAAIAVYDEILGRYTDPGRWIMWKHSSTTGALPAHAAAMLADHGVRPWMYLAADATDEVIAAAGATVNAVGGLLGMPMAATDAKIETAVATGAPVMCWPVRRRSQVTRLTGLGVPWLMAAQATYLSTTDRILGADQWDRGIRSPGEMHYSEDTTVAAIDQATGSVTLTGGTAASLLMGGLCPVTPPASYKVTASMAWATLPNDTLHSDLVVCELDDRAYKHQDTGLAGGYHVVVRPVNSGACKIQLYKHVNGSGTGTLLGALTDTASPEAGAYLTIEVTVDAANITVDRTDVTVDALVVADTSYRGPCIHLAQASSNTAATFKDVTVTDL